MPGFALIAGMWPGIMIRMKPRVTCPQQQPCACCQFPAGQSGRSGSPFSVPRDIPPGFRKHERSAVYFPLLCAGYRVLRAQPDTYFRWGMLLSLKHVRFCIMPRFRDGSDSVLKPAG